MAAIGPISEPWPALPLNEWRDTQETLHLWTQIVGKVKLELTPFLNEWWNVAFTLTPRGLTTGIIPAGAGAFAVDFDFVDHALLIRTVDGRIQTMPLRPRTVATFYTEFLAIVRAMGIEVAINPLPVELPDPIPFDTDKTHRSYDPEPVQRWWRIMVQTEKILQQFRSPFTGKSSDINFFWGSFDLSATRFSGRPAEPPQGAPRFLQLAERQENFACGFWPGNVTMSGVTLGEPAFYAYAYPEPPGFREAMVSPAAAGFPPALGEFILNYEDVRHDAAPAQAIHDFFQSTYEAAADLGHWDRLSLEQIPPKGAAR
jgi:hypothetical protein